MKFKSMGSAVPLILAVSIFLVLGCKPSQRVYMSGFIVGGSNDIHALTPATAQGVPTEAINASVLILTEGVQQESQKRVAKFCSGTLIQGDTADAPKRVLTNHHCFAQGENEDGTAKAELMPEACHQTYVYFGLSSYHEFKSMRISCKPGTLKTSYDADVAVFSLSQEPPAPYVPLELWDGPTDPGSREAVIVHYPNVKSSLVTAPGSDAKLPSASVTRNDCRVIGRFEIGTWDLDKTLPFGLRHTCDIIEGSSGSGLIDVETHKILGVDWGGVKIRFANDLRTDNVATMARYVREWLAGDTKTIDAENATARSNYIASMNQKQTKDKSAVQAAGEALGCGVVKVPRK